MRHSMVIVPHEDDEILLAGGIIADAVCAGNEVTVVMATNGDYEGTDETSGAVRLKETIAGLEMLGLSAEHVIFMGYADTGMAERESFLYGLYEETDQELVHPGHCSEKTYALCGHPDYHSARMGSPAAYTRRNFRQDLRGILTEYQPDVIYTTSREDMHGDHSGLFLFVKEVLKELFRECGYRPVLYSGVVHSAAGDENWPLRDGVTPYTCPPGFDAGTLSWEERIRFPVPNDMREADWSKNRKAQALACHKTALKEDAVEYLYTFIRTEEIFWDVTGEE